MKKIGLLGGMSWESTTDYYRLINDGIKQKLGGLHSAEIILRSVDFAPLANLMTQGDWSAIGKILTEHARKIEAAGADFLLICTNTMHKVAPEIESQLNIPILHIADATAEVLAGGGIEKVALLGTAFTMEHDFYKGRLENRHNIDVVVPDTKQRQLVHDVIFQELCVGKVVEQSAQKYLGIIKHLEQQGAQGVILGCTEIGMLINADQVDIPLFDTTHIHAAKAVAAALQ